MRSASRRAAVRAEVVGAEGVDQHEEDVDVVALAEGREVGDGALREGVDDLEKTKKHMN